MREINVSDTNKCSLSSQLGQFYFMTEFKNPNKTDLQVWEAISLHAMCVKFCPNVRGKWKAIVF